jgi:hypothetical protein
MADKGTADLAIVARPWPWVSEYGSLAVRELEHRAAEGERLREAIERHRDSIQAASANINDCDYELWETLNV